MSCYEYLIKIKGIVSGLTCSVEGIHTKIDSHQKCLTFKIIKKNVMMRLIILLKH